MKRVLNISDETLWNGTPPGIIDGVHILCLSPRHHYTRVRLTGWAAQWLEEHARRRAVAMQRNRELSGHRRRKAHNLSTPAPGASVVDRSSSNTGVGGDSLDGCIVPVDILLSKG